MDELKAGFSVCRTSLNLSKIIEERRHGLGSISDIKFEKCGNINAIKTGKTHRDPNKRQVGNPIWDIKTKAVTGM